MSDEITILPLTREARNVRRFLNLSYAIYEHDPFWVAPLLADLKLVFTDRNPLFEHAQMQLWIASRDGQDVGRIAGVLDEAHNQAQRDSAAFFGFFECVNDGQVSQSLFEVLLAWAREKGVKRVLGPMNPTTNDECGLLVEGFGSSPMLMMTYNPRYYVELIAAQGFRKAKDLLAFHIDLAKCPMDRLSRVAAKVRARWPELKFRPIRRKTLKQELSKVKDVYNEAWEENWGFVPMTDAEVDFMAQRLKPLLMEGIVWLAEEGTDPVGFLLAVPDYNVALKPLRGRLLTPRLLGFLPYLLKLRYPSRTRVIALGVRKRFRGRGLESVMLFEGLKAGADVGFQEAEASWILEDNDMMCRLLRIFGAEPYKTYRLYEREV